MFVVVVVCQKEEEEEKQLGHLAATINVNKMSANILDFC